MDLELVSIDARIWVAHIDSAYLECPQDRRYQFIHLQVADILPYTSSSSCTKGEEILIHLRHSVRGFEPTFGAECVDVLAVDLLASVNRPCIAPDDRGRWDVTTTYVCPTRRNNPFKHQSGS